MPQVAHTPNPKKLPTPMKTTSIAACAAIALSITTRSFAEDRKPDAERPKTPDGEPAKRGERPAVREGERPANREGARPAQREGDRPVAREGERRPEAGPQRGFPGAEVLTQEEREKLRAAESKVNDNAGVKLAEAAMRDAANALRAARDSAILAADPSLEPVLKKLKEARDKAAAGAPRRGEGDQPRRPGAEEPRRREGAPEGARREPAPQK